MGSTEFTLRWTIGLTEVGNRTVSDSPLETAKYVFLLGSKQWNLMLNIVDTTGVQSENIGLLIFGK